MMEIFYCVDLPCSHLFLESGLKLNLNYCAVCGLLLEIMMVGKININTYLLLAFSDLTYHFENRGTGVF